MKKIAKLFSLVLCFISCIADAQTQKAENGYVLSPRQTVRVLTIYAQVDYTPTLGVSDNQDNDVDWPDYNSSVGCTNSLFCSPPNFANDMFDVDWNGEPSEGTLTDYYYEASLGEYIVLEL